jgi:hypothetical protein
MSSAAAQNETACRWQHRGIPAHFRNSSLLLGRRWIQLPRARGAIAPKLREALWATVTGFQKRSMLITLPRSRKHHA